VDLTDVAQRVSGLPSGRTGSTADPVPIQGGGLDMKGNFEPNDRNQFRMTRMQRGSPGWDEFVAARNRAFDSLREASEIYRLEKAWALSTAGRDVGCDPER
jgi:hypothetical protein